MAKFKTADEVAKLFTAGRLQSSPSETKESDLGIRQVWNFWLSVKQVKWLSSQFMRENRDCRWDGRFGGGGEFEVEGETYFWDLRMFPNKAGTIEIARWLEGEAEVEADDTIEVKPEF